MLKYLAMLLMTLDHIGAYFDVFLPYDLVRFLRCVGRLAMPIFIYYLVLGYRRTTNLPRYFLRLLTTAVLTQILWELIAKWTGRSTYVNILFTLALSLALIAGSDLLRKSSRDLMLNMRPITNGGHQDDSTPEFFTVRYSPGNITMPAWLGILAGAFLMGIAIWTTEILQPDYGHYALTLALVYHLCYERVEPLSKTLSAALRARHIVVFAIATFAVTELVFWSAHFQLLLYNPIPEIQRYAALAPLLFSLEPYGNRPSKWSRYFFYAYYPLHLALFMILRWALLH